MTDKHPLYYDSIEDYTADILAAREAHRADREVEEGRCETGDGRKRDGHHRRCWECTHPNGRSKP